jgi:hypothetical protein
MNTRRTTYLAKLFNPNPALKGRPGTLARRMKEDASKHLHSAAHRAGSRLSVADGDQRIVLTTKTPLEWMGLFAVSSPAR